MGRKKTAGSSGALLKGAVALTALLVAGGSLSDAPRLWGVNHLAYHALPVRLAALGLIALALVPPVAARIDRVLTGALDYLSAGRRAVPAVILISLLAVPGFHLFQSDSLLLGDGHMIGSTYDKALAGDTTMTTSSVGRILAHKRIEPGAAIIYLLGARAVTAVTGGSGSEGIRLVNCLLGGVFVLTILMVILRGRLPAGLGPWLGILVFTSGAIELFFGYVEYYTPLILCGTFYVIACFRALHRRGPVWLPVLLALVCVFIHVQAVLLAPSLAVVAAGRFVKGEKAYKQLSMVMAGMTLAAFAAAYLVPRSAAFMLPLWAGPGTGGVLSAGHGLDLFNEIFLLFPLAALFAVMGARVRGLPPAPAGSADAPAWFSRPVEWHFAGMLLFPFVMFMVFFKPEIGMARDWDLFSLFVLGMIPLALLILNRYRAADPEGLRRVTGPAAVLAAVLAVSWIGVCASPVRSAARFADILTYDDSRPGYSWETLARHYQERGLLTEAIAAQRKAVTISGNPRLVVNLCVMYRDAGMVDDSKQLLRELLAVNPGYWVARSTLIQQLIADREFEEGVAQAREGMKAEPALGGYHFYYGKIMLILGRLDDAEPALREARRLGVPPPMAEEIERMLAALPGLRQ